MRPIRLSLDGLDVGVWLSLLNELEGARSLKEDEEAVRGGMFGTSGEVPRAGEGDACASVDGRDLG